MILENYNMHNQTNIYRLWRFKFLLDFDEEDIEDIDDDINDNNNMKLSLIKNMLLIFIILINMILANMIIILKQFTIKI